MKTCFGPLPRQITAAYVAAQLYTRNRLPILCNPIFSAYSLQSSPFQRFAPFERQNCK
ncbi:MAG: hypothetical protein K0Q63_2818 [Paenibacillus sp.]|jgi:hypothetical protein|nr:hypothetical protein [Paenibacillus sp.]